MYPVDERATQVRAKLTSNCVHDMNFMLLELDDNLARAEPIGD